jgi:hypothetical protein
MDQHNPSRSVTGQIGHTDVGNTHGDSPPTTTKHARADTIDRLRRLPKQVSARMFFSAAEAGVHGGGAVVIVCRCLKLQVEIPQSIILQQSCTGSDSASAALVPGSISQPPRQLSGLSITYLHKRVFSFITARLGEIAVTFSRCPPRLRSAARRFCPASDSG